MSFHDKLRIEVLGELYEKGKKSISDLAKAVGVRWKL